MSRKAKQKRAHRKTRNQTRPYDARRGDAITVAWMISAVACALADVISGIGLYLARGVAVSDQSPLLRTITPLMLFIAAITGLLVLCLTPLVYIFRRTPPPIVITVFAIMIAFFPLVALVVLAE